MAHPNEDRLRQGYEAFATGELSALDEFFHDDVKWHAPGNNQLSGDYEGKQAVFELFAKTLEITGGTFRLELHDALANEEHGVALVKVSGQREGKSLEDNQVHVFHVKDGRVSEGWLHPSDQAAVDDFLF